MIRVAIADDHKLFAEGIASILHSDGELVVAKICSNGKELAEYLRSNDVDVVLVDLNMPVLDGASTIRILRNNNVQSKIVVLSMYADNAIYTKCRELDINGYLHKDADAQHLIDTIKRIVAGENIFDYDKTTCTVEDVSNLFKDKYTNRFKLSKREIEIVDLIRSGYTNNEIAEKLFLSVHTVMTHRKNILHKLEVRNTAEMLALLLSGEN